MAGKTTSGGSDKTTTKPRKRTGAAKRSSQRKRGAPTGLTAAQPPPRTVEEAVERGKERGRSAAAKNHTFRASALETFNAVPAIVRGGGAPRRASGLTHRGA
jgi:hypothetical protein